MKILSIFLILTSFLLCADVSFAESDFVERLINFVIFFSILWYLGADKIKQIFSDRKARISQAFQSLQDKEQEVKNEMEKREKLLLDAQAKAKEIVASAKREAYAIAQQFDARLEQDIKNTALSFDELSKQEERKALNQEVCDIIEISLKNVDVSQGACVQILTKGLKNG